jgi:cation:H+ antiporter
MPNIARTMFGADTPSFLLALALLGALTLLVRGAKAFTAAAERVGLALGVAAACSPRGIELGERCIGIDLNFMAGSAALLCLALADAHVGRLEGGVLLAAYAIYVAYQLIGGRTASATILALGTTLPETVVSIAAARAGRPEIAVGNILGSCIFNALAVAGVAALIGGVDAPPEIVRLPLPCFLGASLLFYLLTQDRRVSRWEGLLFVAGYLLLVAEIAGLA